MSKPCPFCGDTRPPNIEEEIMKYDPPNLFVAICQCCGAQGPSAITRGIAKMMWDERREPGDTQAFLEFAKRFDGLSVAERKDGGA